MRQLWCPSNYFFRVFQNFLYSFADDHEYRASSLETNFNLNFLPIYGSFCDKLSSPSLLSACDNKNSDEDILWCFRWNRGSLSYGNQNSCFSPIHEWISGRCRRGYYRIHCMLWSSLTYHRIEQSSCHSFFIWHHVVFRASPPLPDFCPSIKVSSHRQLMPFIITISKRDTISTTQVFVIACYFYLEKNLPKRYTHHQYLPLQVCIPHEQNSHTEHLTRRVLTAYHMININVLLLFRQDPEATNGMNGSKSSTTRKSPVSHLVHSLASNNVLFVVSCYSLQLAVTSLFWNRYIEVYHQLLETPPSSLIQAASYLASAISSNYSRSTGNIDFPFHISPTKIQIHHSFSAPFFLTRDDS